LRAGVERAITTPNLPQDTLATLEETLQEIKRMTQLVDALLTLARADEGIAPLHREPVDLRGIVEEVRETGELLAEESGVQVEVATPPEPMVVSVDATRIRQLILNLLTNAVKYTPRAGRCACSWASPTAGSASAWPTRASASPRGTSPTSSIASGAPTRRARAPVSAPAPGWDSPSANGSPRRTVAALMSSVARGGEPRSRSRSRGSRPRRSPNAAVIGSSRSSYPAANDGHYSDGDRSLRRVSMFDRLIASRNHFTVSVLMHAGVCTAVVLATLRPHRVSGVDGPPIVISWPHETPDASHADPSGQIPGPPAPPVDVPQPAPIGLPPIDARAPFDPQVLLRAIRDAQGDDGVDRAPDGP